MKLDIFYIEQWSLPMDLIIFQTLIILSDKRCEIALVRSSQNGGAEQVLGRSELCLSADLRSVLRSWAHPPVSRGGCRESSLPNFRLAAPGTNGFAAYAARDRAP